VLAHRLRGALAMRPNGGRVCPPYAVGNSVHQQSPRNLMNHTATTTTRFKKSRSFLLLAIAGVLPASMLSAAPQPAALVNPTGGARAAASKSEGLDSLSDT